MGGRSEEHSNKPFVVDKFLTDPCYNEICFLELISTTETPDKLASGPLGPKTFFLAVPIFLDNG